MTLKDASLLFVFKNKLVNGFMTDHFFKLRNNTSADLIGTLVILQETYNLCPFIGRDTDFGCLSSSTLGKAIGMFRTLSPKFTIAKHISTDC